MNFTRLTRIVVVIAAAIAILNQDRLQDIDFLFPYCGALAAFYFVKLFLGLGNRFVVIDILEFLCVNNLLFVPSLFESLSDDYLKEINLMFPLSDSYFLLAVPCVLMLLAGFSLNLKNRAELEQKELVREENKQFQTIGLSLFICGVAFTLINTFFPIGLVADMFASAGKVGILYLLMSRYKSGKILLYVYFGIIMLDSLGRGMMGEFFWWIVVLGMFYLRLFPINIWQKLSYAVVFLFVIGLIQAVKGEYRLATWQNEGELAGMSSSKVYMRLISGKLSSDAFFSPEESLAVLSRFNQGYLTAMTLDYTPDFEPFANGETIYTAVLASMAPRILWPDKPTAGGMWSLERFAGVEAMGNTSMSIGVLGEAYVNFNYRGAAIFLFFYALFINYVYSLFLEKGKATPYIILWIPAAFFGLFSFETDFLTIMNFFVKFMIFFVGLYYAVYNFWRVKLW
ncbi:MAG: hypothetical protein AAFZ15_01785 [Bacteroidota bacterium]